MIDMTKLSVTYTAYRLFCESESDMLDPVTILENV